MAVIIGLSGCSSSAAARSATPEFSGIQLHSLWSTVARAQMFSDLNTARSLRVTAVRIDVGWSTAQINPGGYQWGYVGKLDTFMRAAASRHIKVIATLLTTPCWASSAPTALRQGCRGDWWNRGVQWYPPRDVQPYASFARWFAARYGSELAAVEIWNEPDAPNHQYWMSADPVGSYARLLKAAYREAKQGNASVPVLAGSLAGADSSFLRRLYRAGIRGYYDGIAFHPYSRPSPPNVRFKPGRSTRWSFVAGIRTLRQTQRRAGDQSGLWLTEFGWASGNAFGEVSPRRQASYTAQALRLSGRMPYVRAAIVYALHDDGPNPANWQDNLGLLTTRDRRKPVFYAVRATIAPGQTCRREPCPAPAAHARLR